MLDSQGSVSTQRTFSPVSLMPHSPGSPFTLSSNSPSVITLAVSHLAECTEQSFYLSLSVLSCPDTQQWDSWTLNYPSLNIWRNLHAVFNSACTASHSQQLLGLLTPDLHQHFIYHLYPCWGGLVPNSTAQKATILKSQKPQSLLIPGQSPQEPSSYEHPGSAPTESQKDPNSQVASYRPHGDSNLFYPNSSHSSQAFFFIFLLWITPGSAQG